MFLPYLCFTMEYHIWTEAVQFSLSSPDSAQKRLHSLMHDELLSILEPFPHRRNFANHSQPTLLLLNGSCSSELHFLIPPAQVFTARIHYVTSTDWVVSS